MADTEDPSATILLLEPFYGGSHKQLMDLLAAELGCKCKLVTLPAKKWHWRARVSALTLSQVVPRRHNYTHVLTSSVLALHELAALRPDLAVLHKTVYVHENQLAYPVRQSKERDFQYGYNMILTCLVADRILFNSRYTLDSFLQSIPSFLKLIPDHRPKDIPAELVSKCSVMYFPLELSDIDKLMPQVNQENPTDAGENHGFLSESEQLLTCSNVKSNEVALRSCDKEKVQFCSDQERGHLGMCCQLVGADSALNDQGNRNAGQKCCDAEKKIGIDGCLCEKGHGCSAEVKIDSSHPLHIVWPHRWEHDKNPDSFFSALFDLQAEGLSFSVSVLGETFTDVPESFSAASEKLSSHISHWGYLPTRAEYLSVLRQADVVVSTALHEFFGVAMLEAVHLGCYPLCPERLVYPELYPDHHLYRTDRQLVKQLKSFCRKPWLVRNHECNLDPLKYSWGNVRDSWLGLFN